MTAAAAAAALTPRPQPKVDDYYAEDAPEETREEKLERMGEEDVEALEVRTSARPSVPAARTHPPPRPVSFAGRRL